MKVNHAIFDQKKWVGCKEKKMRIGELIGIGQTANVYEWKDKKVLKLYKEGYSKQTVEEEFYKAMMINTLDFPKAKVYKLVNYGTRYGIVYDRLRGESLQEWVLRTGDVETCGQLMAFLHKKILKHVFQEGESYKIFLKNQLLKVSPGKHKKALKQWRLLSEGDQLCHGDFHPGNIILSDGETHVIDFTNVCRGPFLYDVARTVFLIQYTPVPVDMKNKEAILHLKKSLADIYLDEMAVEREAIQDYLAVIKVSRKGECPCE